MHIFIIALWWWGIRAFGHLGVLLLVPAQCLAYYNPPPDATGLNTRTVLSLGEAGPWRAERSIGRAEERTPVAGESAGRGAGELSGGARQACFAD